MRPLRIIILQNFLTFLFSINMATPDLSAQVTDTTIQVKVADFRGKGTSPAIFAALGASEEGVVVVLINGGGDMLVEKAKGNMEALVRAGYGRIGMILADQLPDEKGPRIGIFSGGHVYADIEAPKADAYNDWAIYNLVRDAYEEDVKPKLDKPNGSGH